MLFPCDNATGTHAIFCEFGRCTARSEDVTFAGVSLKGARLATAGGTPVCHSPFLSHQKDCPSSSLIGAVPSCSPTASKTDDAATDEADGVSLGADNADNSVNTDKGDVRLEASSPSPSLPEDKHIASNGAFPSAGRGASLPIMAARVAHLVSRMRTGEVGPLLAGVVRFTFTVKGLDPPGGATGGATCMYSSESETRRPAHPGIHW